MSQQLGSITLLGTGSSMGIPVVGCDCEVCRSNDPKNTRNRCSALVRYQGKNILIDCGPDFHQQALHQNLKDLHGVIFTHAHFDHIAGLDELRLFNFRSKKALPALASRYTFEELRKRFSYLFEERKKEGNFTAQFDFTILTEDSGQESFQGLPLSYVTYRQGTTQVSGFRFGDFAYISDIKFYSDSIFRELSGVKTLVVSALRERTSHVHLTIDEAVEFAAKTKAKQTYFIHMDHEVEHNATNAKLPTGVELAYDGLQVPFEV